MADMQGINGGGGDITPTDGNVRDQFDVSLQQAQDQHPGTGGNPDIGKKDINADLPEGFNRNTDFLAQGTFGVFPEILPPDYRPEKPETNVNLDDRLQTWFKDIGQRDQDGNVIGGLDVQQLAKDEKDSGAKWVYIAFTQGAGIYSAPNQTWDNLLAADGEKPRSPTRDFFGDYAKAVVDQGMKVIAYIPANISSLDDPAGQKAAGYGQDNLDALHKNTADIVKEFSDRYGNLISGWWFDESYQNPAQEVVTSSGQHISNSPESLQQLADSAKSGNPNAVVGFNRYAFDDKAFTLGHVNDDYTGGESLGLPDIPGSRVADGGQYHALTWLGGDGYYSPGVRYDDQKVIDYTKGLKDTGGAITYDLYWTRDSHLDPEQQAQLAKAREAIS